MVPPTSRVNGEPHWGPDEEPGGEDPGGRWSWLFWCAFVAAAGPALVSLALTVTVYQDDAVVRSYTSTPDSTTPLEFGDRWAVVLLLDQPGWAATMSALATLVLAALVVGGRPAWLQVPSGRVAVLGLAVAVAVWALVPALVTCGYLFSDPTPAQEAARAQWGQARTGFGEWVATGGQSLLAAGVGAVAAWWCAPRRSHERVGEDAVERAPAR